MPNIYLRHAVHGSKVANAEAEAVYDEGNGWVRYDPTAVVSPPVEPEDPPAEPTIRRRRARQE